MWVEALQVIDSDSGGRDKFTQPGRCLLEAEILGCLPMWKRPGGLVG